MFRRIRHALNLIYQYDVCIVVQTLIYWFYVKSFKKSAYNFFFIGWRCIHFFNAMIFLKAWLVWLGKWKVSTMYLYLQISLTTVVIFFSSSLKCLVRNKTSVFRIYAKCPWGCFAIFRFMKFPLSFSLFPLVTIPCSIFIGDE